MRSRRKSDCDLLPAAIGKQVGDREDRPQQVDHSVAWKQKPKPEQRRQNGAGYRRKPLKYEQTQNRNAQAEQTHNLMNVFVLTESSPRQVQVRFKVPELEPNLSTSRPCFCSSVRNRFANGVLLSLSNATCRPCLKPPPASTTGRLCQS